MATVTVKCPLCDSEHVVKFGSSGGKQRYQCRQADCEKNTFLLDYSHTAYAPGVKEKIVEMALNGSGIRDTSRVLGVGLNTVLRTLKKKKSS